MSAIPPENILKHMSPTDRKSLGKSGQTAAESEAKFIAKSEREIQNQIANWMLLHQIWFTRSAMNKRTTNTLGTPDFLFAINGKACAIEVKMPSCRTSEDQNKCIISMVPNGWNVAICHSLQEAIEFINKLQ